MEWDLDNGDDEQARPTRAEIDDEPVSGGKGGRSGGGGRGKAAPEEDMFVLERVQWRTYQPKLVKRVVAAARKVLVMGTRDGHVIRVPLDHPEDLEDIGDLAKKEADRASVFLDPLGAHVIVGMPSGDNFYLNEAWKKPKAMPRMKDVVVASVAWDLTNTDRSTSGSILVGSSKGHLFECVLDVAEKGSTKVWRPLFNTDTGGAIEGLAIERPSPSKFYVLAVTATRLFEFTGGGTLQTVFEHYDSGKATPLHELPSSSLSGHAELHLLRRARDGPATSFAWLAEAGVFHGTLKIGPELNPGDSAVGRAALLKYPDAAGGRAAVPVSMAMTELHFLFVYADKFQAVRRLDEAVVFEQAMPSKIGKVQGLCVDEWATPRLIWAYSEQALFEVQILNEDRDMAGVYLRLGNFEGAKTFAKTPQQIAAITSAQADHLFEAGKYDLAAALYGKTDRQFEEIALRFIDKGANTALRAFLVNKLSTLTMRESTQKTMICTWLVEIYLNRLNALQEADDEASREEMASVAAEFRQMLDENRAFLDYKTTIGLITSHGRVKEMIFYANLMEDYERVINAFITEGDYKNALVVLQRQTSEELFYRFSPILMHHAPYHTVNSWIKAASLLKPRKLIPALMRYDPAKNPEDDPSNQAIRYLEFCTKKVRSDDEAIHNYLLSLYCQTGDEGKVCELLDEPQTHFDLKYGLRLCSQHNMRRGQVLIYGLMKLFEEAVELALGFDLELAKTYASKPDDDEQAGLKKRLWLRIAKHVVTGDGNIKQAMEFLRECQVLKIEDILPFFPEFTLIDTFKDEICESLENYNLEIDELRQAMDQSTKSADEIRSDIQKLNQNYGFVEGQQRCQTCEAVVLTREFYLFPCQHVFHADCLVQQMVGGEFDDAQRARYNTLTTQIRQLEQAKPGAASAEDGRKAKLARIRATLDELVAPECPLCGMVSIKSVARPLFDPQEARSWQLRSE